MTGNHSPGHEISKQPLKIAHVTPVFPPYWSGTSNVAYFNALEVARLGHQVQVFTSRYPLNGYRDPAELKVHRLQPLFKIGNAPFTPSIVFKLRSFDLVHLHWPYIFGSELTWIITKMLNIPYVMTYHLDLRADRRWVFGIYQSFWGPRLGRSACKIIAVSDNHLRSSQLYPHIVQRGGVISEIANGVDVAQFHPGVSGEPIRKKLGISVNAEVILFVGAMDSAHEYKGVPDLLRVFKQIDRKNTFVVLVGDGDLRLNYEDVVKSLPEDKKNHVLFVGSIPHFQLPAYYAAADICVLPSRQPESFGMTLIEAMACGVPVIASDSPGVRSVISDSVDGMLFSIGDLQDLENKLNFLLDQPDRRILMGQNGRKKVVERYAWDHIGLQLEKLYFEVLNES